MFYKLCILKINGFCIKDLLYEHEFPLKVWLWTLLETVPESSWSIHMQPMTLRARGENLLMYYVINKGAIFRVKLYLYSHLALF